MKCLSVSILIWITANLVLADDWGYQDESEWGGLCKTGTRQSPIDLVEAETEDVMYSAFSFDNYHIYNNATITNNGHSVAIRMDGPVAKISGGGLLKPYILNHFHFHWNSEHTINGARFPLEMHLVHFSSDYSTLEEAVQHMGGIAVLGVLFHQSLDHDDELKPLVKAVEEVLLHHNTKAAISKTIAAQDFLPRDTADYYRYLGSLTTPGCNEGVIWTVFTNTLPISADQVNYFKSVMLKDGSHTLNYRPVQPLNGRVVSLRSSQTRRFSLSASTTSTSLKTMLIFTMLPFIKTRFF